MTSTTATAPAAATAPIVSFPKGRWAALTVLLVGQFMGLIDALIVNVTLPLMGRQLGASPVILQLVVGGYVASYAVVLLLGARLGNAIGHRRTFIAGLLVFTAASLLCGLAPSATLLVLFRVIQGAGAGLMIPQVMSLIQLGFTGGDRARALSAYGVVIASGAAVGLLAGGLIAGADLLGLGWRPIFLLNLPVGAAVLVAARRYLPSSTRTGASPRIDAGGIVLGALAVAVLFLSTSLGPSLPGGILWIAGGVPAGVLLGAAFLLQQSRRARAGHTPLFDPRVLGIGGFRWGLLAMAAAQVAYGGFLFAYTLHLHRTTSADAIETGLTYLALAIPFGVVGYGWRHLPARVWPYLVPTGLLASAGAYLGLFGTAPGTPAALGLLALLGVGLGLSASPLLTQALKPVPPALAGTASAGLATTIQLGQAIGVAAFGSGYASVAGSSTGVGMLGILLAGCAIVGMAACVRGSRRRS